MFMLVSDTAFSAGPENSWKNPTDALKEEPETHLQTRRSQRILEHKAGRKHLTTT